MQQLCYPQVTLRYNSHNKEERSSMHIGSLFQALGQLGDKVGN